MVKKINTTEIKNLLVIVPHQDDEILIAAGLIREVVKNNGIVNVVLATNGDYGCRDYSKGYSRMRECIKGLEILGVNENQIFFLGYADTGMNREDSFLYRMYKEQNTNKILASITSKLTYGISEKEEFHYQLYHEHAQYTKQNFITDLKTLIEIIQPDTIVTTHQEDIHGDHEALFYFVRDILVDISHKKPQLYSGLVHSKAGDGLWPERDNAKFTKPEYNTNQKLLWENRYILDLKDEMNGGKCGCNLKYKALLEHKTALEPNAVDFLEAFIKDEEIFWKIDLECYEKRNNIPN